MNNQNIAFGVIDAQRGFMPKSEGLNLGLEGFGDLEVADGEQIIPVINKVLAAFALDKSKLVFTTQDWHPKHTAHFADEPNYSSTWPTHCVAGTPSVEIHPHINVPEDAARFYKGYEQLISGEDDTSYSGFNALSFDHDEKLLNVLRSHNISTVYLGGLALDYCVGATAFDLATQTNLDVVVITDATKPVANETGIIMIEKLEAAGVHITTSEKILATLAESEK